jgi:hypothetical protein
VQTYSGRFLFNFDLSLTTGTTESILLSKEQLFDVSIEDSRMRAVLAENQKSLLRVSSGDKKKFELLMKRLK